MHLPTVSPGSRRLVNNAQTLDLTTGFREAAARLPAGTLVKDEHFTLFEAVGALEIGDAKMDNGFLLEGGTLEDDYDVSQPLLPEELIWLMDELVAREVAWHLGYPLSQTLFTSIHLDQLLSTSPRRVVDAQFKFNASQSKLGSFFLEVLRAYCLGLVKSSDLVLSMVTSQHYYEEEDFATQLFNRDLLHQVPVDSVLDAMKSVMELMEIDQHMSQLHQQQRDGISTRIHLRYLILQLLQKNASGISADQEGLKSVMTMLDRVHRVDHETYTVHGAFSTKIQRRLASTVPPRSMVTISQEETWQYWKQLLKDSVDVFGVLQATHSQDLMVAYWLFASQKPHPAVYIRSLLQSLLAIYDRGRSEQNQESAVMQDICSMTIAASPLAEYINFPHSAGTAEHLMAIEHFNNFTAKITQSYSNLFRTACLNRCRIRRTLCHAVIEWDQMQAEAEEVDDSIQSLLHEQPIAYPYGASATHSYPVSSWVYHHKLTQLRLVVQLGFELSVYAPYEVSGMYWYVSHICEIHLGHLERISFFISARDAALPPINLRNAKQQRLGIHCKDTLYLLYRTFSVLKATQKSAQALHGLYVLLQRHGAFPEPEVTYSTGALRYELRMKWFQSLSIPEPIDFEDFVRLQSLDDQNDAQLMSSIGISSKAAKRAWEEVLRSRWHGYPTNDSQDTTAPVTTGRMSSSVNITAEQWSKDIMGAMKASIAVGVAVATLGKLGSGGVQAPGSQGSIKADIPQIGDRDHWHAWWLVPRIES